MGQMINGKIVTLRRCQPPQAERKTRTLQKVPKCSCPPKGASGPPRLLVLLSNGDQAEGASGLQAVENGAHLILLKP